MDSIDVNVNEPVKYTNNLLTYVVINKGTFIRRVDKKTFIITNEPIYEFISADMKFILSTSHVLDNIDEQYQGIYDEMKSTLEFF